MRNLKNGIAGVAGLVILVGALVATPNTANAQSSRLRPANANQASIDAALSHASVPELGSCQILQAPAGHKVAFATFAEGFQIYRWNGATWAFVAPDATLYADAEGNGLVGIHYAGPTWESNSGSKVVAKVVERCTPDPTAIPWLLLEAVHTEGPGIFERVTHIQRVNTVGGIAPTVPGAFTGEVVRVPYTTDYVFYRAQE